MGSDQEYIPMGVSSQRSGGQCHPGECSALPRASAWASTAADPSRSQPSGQLRGQEQQVVLQLDVAMQMAMSLTRPDRADGSILMLWSLACKLLVLPALCGVPHGVVALLMGANDAGCPAGTGNGCAWAHHGPCAYSPSLGVTPLD
eukprot:5449530-Pyramimonas_sp.AAC.1